MKRTGQEGWSFFVPGAASCCVCRYFAHFRPSPPAPDPTFRLPRAGRLRRVQCGSRGRMAANYRHRPQRHVLSRQETDTGMPEILAANVWQSRPLKQRVRLCQLSGVATVDGNTGPCSCQRRSASNCNSCCRRLCSHNVRINAGVSGSVRTQRGLAVGHRLARCTGLLTTTFVSQAPL